jgi:hypothetical protein
MENVVRIHSLARTSLWRPSPASFAGGAPHVPRQPRAADGPGRPVRRGRRSIELAPASFGRPARGPLPSPTRGGALSVLVPAGVPSDRRASVSGSDGGLAEPAKPPVHADQNLIDALVHILDEELTIGENECFVPVPQTHMVPLQPH